jgi:hypothetical protein
MKEKVNFKLGISSNLSPSILSFMNTSYPHLEILFSLLEYVNIYTIGEKTKQLHYF